MNDQKLSKRRRIDAVFVGNHLDASARRRLAHLSTSLDSACNDPEPLRGWIEVAGHRISKGLDLPADLQTFVGDALIAIASGADANRAFGLRMSRRHSVRFSRSVIAMVEQARGPSGKEQLPLSKAFELVAKAITNPSNPELFAAYPMDADAVRKIWEKHKGK